ncbi:MAG: tyrosine-type recombinase/integrase [Hyphomicrobiales bacterium]|nr:tyrosine-type recombinase/integrase [Hyphomicrobiales bacterium]
MAPYLWLFIEMGLSSSMRHGEILSGRFDRFDPDRRRIRVKTKGGRWRDQPLTAELADILTKEREMAEDPDGWMFTSKRSKSGHVEQMSRPFQRCVIGAELDPGRITPHTLRHTALTRFSKQEQRPKACTPSAPLRQIGVIE